MLSTPAEIVQLLIIATVVTLFGYGYARAKQRTGQAPGRPTRGQIAWSGTYSDAFQRTLDVLGMLEAQVVQADPNRGTILARPPFSWLHAGPTIRIALLTQEGVTNVYVEAGSAGLFDGGLSRRFVRDFLRVWERLPTVHRV